MKSKRTSLAVQRLRLCPSNAGGMGSITGPGTMTLHAVQWSKKWNQRSRHSWSWNKWEEMKSKEEGKDDVSVPVFSNIESEKCKVKVLVPQLCPTVCDPMDCRSPGSYVSGILQARTLEWIPIPFSKGSFRPRDQTWVSCVTGGFFTVWAIRCL